MTVRVRFAPSPTGSLHLGNALTAVANRRFADERGGTLVLRIDDTDATRTVDRGDEAIVADLGWLGIAWDEGPMRQSERAPIYADAAATAEREGGAVRDADGSLRLDGVTLLRADGSATYQLATVADDLDLGITHVIRGSDHRPNEAPQRRIARALGGRAPGGDPSRPAPRRGREEALEASRARVGRRLPRRRDPRRGAARVPRRARSARARRPPRPGAHRPARDRGDRRDGGRGARGGRGRARRAPPARSAARARSSRRARSADRSRRRRRQRFRRRRGRRSSGSSSCVRGAPERLDEPAARAIVRELKAVGGDLRSLRLALTGRAAWAGALDGRRCAAAGRGARARAAGASREAEAESRLVYDRAMRLQDTLTGSLVELPPPPEPIGIYVCGPTVYQRAHIGNARPFVVFTWLARWLRARGHEVRLVHNITDVNDKIYEAAPGPERRAGRSRRPPGTSRTPTASGSGCPTRSRSPRRRCRRSSR